MARIGISFEDVANAALQLQGQGKSPTVDAVREILGTGSKTTINHHLKEWRATQTENIGTVPSALAALVTGLWERIQAEAEQKVSAVTAEHLYERENLQSIIVDSQQSLKTIKQQLIEMTERYQAACKCVENLEMDYCQIKQALAQLQERYEATNDQLTDTKLENTRLHQLASQIQTNLEHYQQAIEQLRVEQMFEHEKQQIDHKSQLAIHREEIQRLTYEQTKQNQALIESQQELAKAASQHEQEQRLMTERNQHLEQSLLEKIEIEKKAEKRIDMLEQQIAVLLNQHQRLQCNAEQTIEKQISLQQEIRTLMTENHQLQLSLNQTVTVNEQKPIEDDLLFEQILPTQSR